MSPRTPKADSNLSPIEVTWEAPPERLDAIMRRFIEAMEKVKQSPGRWALLRSGPQGTITGNRSKILRHVSDERWEIVSHWRDNHTYGLWARYRTEEQMKEAK